jgi:hypothetical protein
LLRNKIDASFMSTPPKRYPATILATCPVPWTSTYDFDEELFKKTVSQLTRELSSHVYIFGTAGEGHAVTDCQFGAIVRAFRAALPRQSEPMIGVISLSLGTVIERIVESGNVRFRIQSSISHELKVDNSLMHDGVCLTVTKVEQDTHHVTAVDETLKRTCLGGWNVGTKVNLERSLLFNGRVEGHLVQGHVDTTANSISIDEAGAVTELSDPVHESPSALLERAAGWGGSLKWAGAGAHAHASAIGEFAREKNIIWSEEFLEDGELKPKGVVSWALARPCEAYAEQIAALGLNCYRQGEALTAGDLQADYVRLSDAELNEKCRA